MGSAPEPIYSRDWRATFGGVDPDQTAREAAFLERVLPLAEFACVLDVACGPGRHLRALRERGYRGVGIDIDASVVAEARRSGLDVRLADMRRLGVVGTPFDAIVCLWASFGFFDAATNQGILGAFRDRLRPGGRLVLDVYHRRFFEECHGERSNRGVTERKTVTGGRLTVELGYPGGGADRLEWQLYTPEELVETASRHAFRPVVACSEFDERRPPSRDVPRMQLVFEHADSGRVPSLTPTHPRGCSG